MEFRYEPLFVNGKGVYVKVSDYSDNRPIEPSYFEGSGSKELMTEAGLLLTVYGLTYGLTKKTAVSVLSGFALYVGLFALKNVRRLTKVEDAYRIE